MPLILVVPQGLAERLELRLEPACDTSRTRTTESVCRASIRRPCGSRRMFLSFESSLTISAERWETTGRAGRPSYSMVKRFRSMANKAPVMGLSSRQLSS